MTSSFLDIYSKFLGLVDSYDFLEISETDAYEMMGEWLDAVLSRPKVRKMFSKISIDPEVMIVEYTMLSPIDEVSDKKIVEGLFANGMVLEWLTPRLNSDSGIKQMFGTKEQKFYAQSTHMAEIREICNNARDVLDRDYIRDRGYAAFLLNKND